MIYQETPTGTIDGVNTSFTTASTMEEVLYVVADGVVTDAYTKSGTTLIMSVAPTTSLIITYDEVPKPRGLNTGYTLGELKQLLTTSLGTSETRLNTEEKRENAINKAITDILEQYPVPQYTRNYATMNFVDGVCPLPTDMLVARKMWNVSENTEYFFPGTDKFDNNFSKTADIKYDETHGVENVQIYPATTVTLSLRYTSEQEALSDDSDKTRFRKHWATAIADMAAYWLLLDNRNPTADSKYIVARNQVAKAWQVEAQRYASPTYNKLESAFSKKSILGRNSNLT